MGHNLRSGAPAAAVLVLLGACASGAPPQSGAAAQQARSTPPTAQERALARYLSYAGPPIPYFTWLGHFYSWEPLGKDQIVVFTTSNEAYLLKIWAPCDLRFGGVGVGVTSLTNTVYARTDSVITGGKRCPIDEIRRIDYPRMQSELRQQAAANTAADGAAAQPGGADKSAH